MLTILGLFVECLVSPLWVTNIVVKEQLNSSVNDFVHRRPVYFCLLASHYVEAFVSDSQERETEGKEAGSAKQEVDPSESVNIDGEQIEELGDDVSRFYYTTFYYFISTILLLY